MNEERPSSERHGERDSQLSAMFDGELSAAECELLARRLTRDEALRAQWTRYALIGGALRAERGVKLDDRIARRVQAQVAQEPSYGDSATVDTVTVRPAAVAPAAHAAVRSASERWMRFARPVMGAGIAAGVAAVSIMFLRNQGADSEILASNPATQSVEAADSVAPQADAPAPAPTLVAATEPAPVLYSTPAPSTQTSIAPPTRFANYVVAHSEVSGPLARRMALLGIVGTEASGDVAEQPAEAPESNRAATGGANAP